MDHSGFPSVENNHRHHSLRGRGYGSVTFVFLFENSTLEQPNASDV